MSPEAALIVTLISACIGLVISFFLIRGAVLSALRDFLGEYRVPSEIHRTLEGIEQTLTKMNEHLSRQKAEGKPEKEDMLPKEQPGEAVLLYRSICSKCGEKQRSNRIKCYKCGAIFVKPSDEKKEPH